MPSKDDTEKIKTRTDQLDVVESIILELKEAIDRINYNFRKAKDLILELARTLDESEQCERTQISMKIKEILKGKINEGKITAKWIHDCLPSEYKREYSKREVSSLSKNNSMKGNSTEQEKVMQIGSGGQSVIGESSPFVDSSGKTENEAGLDTEVNKPNISPGQQSYSSDQSLTESEAAFLKASPIVPAHQVSHDGDRTYRISKDKLGLLITAIKSSREFCSVTFDKNGLLVRVQSDKAFDGN
jgi:hypothetical protein